MDTPYDKVHYESYSYSLSHPQHLYTMARLFGVEAPDFRTARVLELGCASGGNLIPMAFNYPDATFVGIDLSEGQIKDGQEVIKTLKMKNIELKAMSIMDVKKSFGEFDYIISHGIFSWVPEEVQEKMLEIFHNNLSPKGVAYMSYNTYPGWCMVRSIRDMMLYHAGHIEDPNEKAQQARALLAFIVEGLEGDTSSYADFLRNEINLLKNQPNSYLLHDHLEEVNQPVYFYQMIDRAQKHKLGYLSDATLPLMFVGNLPGFFAEEVGKVKNIVLANQYMDFIRNQRFRATLFCHEDVQIKRNLDTKDIEQFYVCFAGTPSRLLTEEEMQEGKEIKYQSGGVTLTTSNHITKVAMKIIMEESPLSYDNLVKRMVEMLKDLNEDQVKKHLNNDLNLLRLALGGFVTLQASEGMYSRTANDKPKTTPLVIEQARLNRHVTNQMHNTVQLNDFERTIIQLLDGKHHKDKIIKVLASKVTDGTFNIFDKDKNKVLDQNEIRLHLEDAYQKTIDKFVQSALIIQ